jgi:hypothetical protein
MPKTAAIRTTSVVWVVAGMLASTAAVVCFWPAGNELKATYWRDQLATASDERVAECLTRLSELGDPGVRALVESLASSRPLVVSHARTLLLREIDGWELLPIRQAVSRLTSLAEALAQHSAEFDAARRALAADLSLRIMLWPGRQELPDQRRLLAACDKILRATGSVSDRQELRIAGRRGGSEVAPDSVFSQSMLGPTALPGGGIPAEPAQATASPNSVAKQGAVASTEKTDPTAASKPPLRFSPPAVARPVPAEVATNDPVSKAAANPQPSVAANTHATLNKQAAFLAAVNADESALVNVMRQLHSPDSREASAAQAELERRGFKPAHLELAWSLTDNDPNIRRQLAEVLPGGQGYRVRFLEPWTDFPTDDALADTARMNRWIESEVRRLPAQYLWVHKRFKTRPKGEPSLYANDAGPQP